MKRYIFNVKEEALFVSLASYAHNIIKAKDIYGLNGEAIYMANIINKHFSLKIKRYNNANVDKLTKYLNEICGPAFPDKINASIIMVATLNYLFKEKKHKETCIAFAPIRDKVITCINLLENSEHKEELLLAYKTIVNMLDEKPSNYKHDDEFKLKAILTNYSLVKLLKDVISKINYVKFDKHKQKLNQIYDTYIDMNTINKNSKDILLENVDIYVLVSLLNRIQNLGISYLPIDKFKKINLNYLVPDKDKLLTTKKDLDKIVETQLLI